MTSEQQMNTMNKIIELLQCTSSETLRQIAEFNAIQCTQHTYIAITIAVVSLLLFLIGLCICQISKENSTRDIGFTFVVISAFAIIPTLIFIDKALDEYAASKAPAHTLIKMIQTDRK